MSGKSLIKSKEETALLVIDMQIYQAAEGAELHNQALSILHSWVIRTSSDRIVREITLHI